MLSPSSPAQKHLSEEDSSGSDGGSEVSVEPETDRFGFILTNGCTAGSVGPPPELVRQRETKWINIMVQWERMLLKKTSKVKVQCQKGIPASLRAKCWPLLCAATERMKQSDNLYESLDSQAALQSWVDVIERDLDRQFPFHEMFLSKDGHGQRGLFRVLKAYTQYQPEEGYCQAQGPVAAVLLMNMPAEEAFWCLVQISEQYLPGYYSPLLEGVLFDAGMLTWVLKRTCPSAHKHLQHHGVEPLMFATDWLMCLFTRHLPFNTLLRVWDLFFCYGVRVLLQVAVVLVRRVLGRAEQRKQCQGQMETLERLRGVREQVQDEDDAFITEVCSVPLSARDLEKQTQKELDKWRKEKPSSTFDPRGRCLGYQMAWAKVRHTEEERDRKERQKGNLSVPLARSASTLSLSPSLLHKRLRRGAKGSTSEWEGGGKIVRHLSMGAREDWRNLNEFNFKKVQGVQEEEDEEHKKQSESNPTQQTEEKQLLEEHRETDKDAQNEPTEHTEETVAIKEEAEKVLNPKETDKEQNEPIKHTEETVTIKEEVEKLETKIEEGEEENQQKEVKDDSSVSEEREETHEESEPSRGPAEDQAAENVLKPAEEAEELDSNSQAQVLEEQKDEVQDQDQDQELKDTKEEAEEQVSESEHLVPEEENQIEIQREAEPEAEPEAEAEAEAEADTSTEQEIQANVDLSEEQVIQADVNPEDRTEENPPQTNIEEETQEETVTDVSETRAESSPDSETNSDTEAVTFTDSGLTTETEAQEEVKEETDKTSQGDVFGIESSADADVEDEHHTPAQTYTEEKVEENSTVPNELETEEVQTDSQHTESLTETTTEAQTLILPSPEHTDAVADTEREAEAPAAGDTAEESSEACAHCSEEDCDTVATEPTQEKEEIILTEPSEAQVDSGLTAAEETPTETGAPDCATPPENEETSQPAEAGNVNTEPDGETSPAAASTTEGPAPEEQRSQDAVGPTDEEESTGSVQGNTAGEDDVFTSAPAVTDNACTDSNPHDPSPLSGQRSSRSSGDFCVRKPSSSRGSRLARRLSEDLFIVPQKTGQSQPVPNQPEVKHSESPSNPGAVDPTQPPPDATQPSKDSLSLAQEVTTSTTEEEEPPSTAKRFGLFRRLRGEQPKKANKKGAQKMQVPKILIQDFSDGTVTGKQVEEEGDEKLSSRERRRRRRERERKEKEEERLRKKKEKDEEKERERKKTQTGGRSGQKEKVDQPQPAKTDSETLRYSSSYSESYF